MKKIIVLIIFLFISLLGLFIFTWEKNENEEKITYDVISFEDTSFGGNKTSKIIRYSYKIRLYTDKNISKKRLMKISDQFFYNTTKGDITYIYMYLENMDSNLLYYSMAIYKENKLIEFKIFGR